MEKDRDTISVKELIEQLQKIDENIPVVISVVGFSAKDSFDYPLEFGNKTVDVFQGKCRINVTYL